MSAQGQTRTSADVCGTSASPPIADMPGSPSDVAEGPRPCENSSAFRARRRMAEKLRIMKLNHPAQIRLDTVLENCIFYVLPMYEFSHSLGQEPTSRSSGQSVERHGRPKLGVIHAHEIISRINVSRPAEEELIEGFESTWTQRINDTSKCDIYEESLSARNRY
jgi:hypothetical protein